MNSGSCSQMSSSWKRPIVYYTYNECCEPCSFRHFNILIQNIHVFFCILSRRIIYDWITIIWDTVSMNLAQ